MKKAMCSYITAPKRLRFQGRHAALVTSLLCALPACGSTEVNADTDADGGSAGTGVSSGGSATGGSATGGSPTGGSASGGVNSGGAVSSGGASGAGSGGSSGSAGAGSGEIGVIGESCDSPGALACAGNHQKVTTVCGAEGTWVVNETCGAGQFCDSAPGPNVGLCREPTAECVDATPGDRFCVDQSVMQCGPDVLTVDLVEECQYGCMDGECGSECPDNLILNCSDTCGGPSPECFEGCSDTSAGPGEAPLLTLEPGTYIIRTGAAGNNLCDCHPEQEGDGTWYAMFFARLPYSTTGYEARAQAPWQVDLDNPSVATQLLCTSGTGVAFADCSENSLGEPRLSIAASEPDAPPTDVILQVFAEAPADFCQPP